MITIDNYLDQTDHACGRYALEHPEWMKKRFAIKGKVPEVKPNYNAAPTQDMPVVVQKDKANAIEIMRWGLQPVWAKDQPNFAWKTFNARAETLQEKPMWKGPFKKHRCLVPATGYYEWQKIDSKTKQPYFFYLEDHEMFAFAGLYDEWTDKDSGEITRTYSIVTTSPNKIQSPIHDRMPVILNQDEESVWLDSDQDDLGFLESLLNPFTEKGFDLYPVDVAVGNSRNNSPDLVKPISE